MDCSGNWLFWITKYICYNPPVLFTFFRGNVCNGQFLDNTSLPEGYMLQKVCKTIGFKNIVCKISLRWPATYVAKQSDVALYPQYAFKRTFVTAVLACCQVLFWYSLISNITNLLGNSCLRCCRCCRLVNAMGYRILNTFHCHCNYVQQAKFSQGLVHNNFDGVAAHYLCQSKRKRVMKTVTLSDNVR